MSSIEPWLCVEYNHHFFTMTKDIQLISIYTYMSILSISTSICLCLFTCLSVCLFFHVFICPHMYYFCSFLSFFLSSLPAIIFSKEQNRNVSPRRKLQRGLKNSPVVEKVFFWNNSWGGASEAPQDHQGARGEEHGTTKTGHRRAGNQ